MTDKKKSTKNKITRADRNSPEAQAEESNKPYDHIGKPDEQIQAEEGYPEQEPGPGVKSVPTDGS